MNIVYTVFSFKVGGVEKLLIDILNNISEESNNRIYLIIINDEYDSYLLSQISERVKVILFNRKPNGNKIKYILRFNKFIIEEKIDIIHCQCMKTIKFSVLSKLLNRKIKLIHTVHDTRIYRKLRSLDIWIDKIFVNKIIAISSAVKNDIISKKIQDSKIEIVYNAIDLEKFRSKSNKLINKDSIVIGNVARLIPKKKGQDVLIKAISILKNNYPNIKCLLAGNPPKGQEKNIYYLNKMSEELGVKENVYILGNINDIPNFLNEIDIFVMPSRYDGFGISLIEAMSMGIPCIASNIDGPKEILKDNKFGLLFTSEDYNDLAEKIESIINKSYECNQEEIKKYIHENYEIKSMVKHLIEVYKM